MIVTLFVILVPCLTIVVSVLMVTRAHMATHQITRSQRELVNAKAKTATDLEAWKQDWILQQREGGERPALPPGTQEII